MLLFLPAVLNGPAPLQQLALNYDKALIRHPVVTRTATGAALAAAGDAVAQFREQRQLRQQRPALGDYNGMVKPTAAISRPYDVRRAAALVLVEGFYRGILQQVIIAWIISAFTGDGLRRLGLGRLFGSELCALLERVSFNQLVIAPNVYYSMFFITTGAFQGLSWGQIVKRWRSQLPRLVGLNSLYWFPVQLLQFAVVPMRYKVPFICAAGLVWNVILSLLAGSALKEDESPTRHQHAAAEHEPLVRCEGDGA